jgi:alkylation response protein AidB-like acyl-CoA dehydrogenase
MQFELDEDRALLKSSTRELLEKEAQLAETRAVMEETPEGYSKAFYAQLGELGYPALLLPEQEGGMGAVAFAAVLSEMGRVALPGPFLDLALAVRLLAACQAPEAAAWRDRAIAGEALVVLARPESLASADPALPESRFEAGQVRGTKCFVPFGAHADALLVETREGLVLVERPGAGWSASELPTIDHAQRFAEVVLDEPGVLVADPALAPRLLGDAGRLGALGASALMLGHAAPGGEHALGGISRRLGGGVRPRAGPVSGGGRQGLGGPRRALRVRTVHPAPRRRRLYLGVRPPHPAEAGEDSRAVPRLDLASTGGGAHARSAA